MRRPAAFVSLLAGLAVMAAAQLLAPPGSPPLYDGVVVREPYRYLVPTQGQVGSPTSYQASLTVGGTTSPQFVAATTESPPQAQLIAQPGAFVVPAGASAMTVSIEPVGAPTVPASGPIAGNVYRFMVADQTAAPLPVNANALPTLLLRAPADVVDAVIARFAGGAWQELPTGPSGQPSMAITNVDALGDFALIAKPAPGVFGLDPRLLGGAAVAAVLSVVGLWFFVSRSQRRPRAVRGVSPQRRPAPSKRRTKGRRQGRAR
jgi:hypothetical protein